MLAKLDRYGGLNSHDLLKFTAIIIMIIDHAGLYLFPEQTFLRAIGRSCVPIWFFLVGMHKPSKFSWDIVFFAIAIDILNIATGHFESLNILFSIIIIRALLQLNEKFQLHKQGYLLPIIFSIIFYPITGLAFSYGTLGFMLAYCGYLQRIGFERQKLFNFFAVATSCFLLVQFWVFGFSFIDMAISGLLTIAITIWLFNYELKKVWIGLNMVLKKIIMIAGRYSLELYAIHIAIFIAVKELLI